MGILVYIEHCWEQSFASKWVDKRSRCVILTTCCSTSEQTTLLPPTCTSMGLLRILRARASIALGKVAENMTVWRSGLTLSTMRITCGERTLPVNIQVLQLYVIPIFKLRWYLHLTDYKTFFTYFLLAPSCWHWKTGKTCWIQKEVARQYAIWQQLSKNPRKCSRNPTAQKTKKRNFPGFGEQYSPWQLKEPWMSKALSKSAAFPMFCSSLLPRDIKDFTNRLQLPI